jgi:hypothetical protein
MLSMPARASPSSRDRDPLTGIDRLLVDANNLLGALERHGRTLPPAALIGRLRAVVPPGVAVELVFDGRPERGPGRRLTSGVTVRYSGARTADALLLTMLQAAGPMAPGYEPTTLVVTDDAALRRDLQARGAATARTAWLIRRLERTRLTAPSVGNARPPKVRAASDDRDSDADGDDARRRGWQPGRGATTKTGNPRRTPRRRRTTDGAR